MSFGFKRMDQSHVESIETCSSSCSSCSSFFGIYELVGLYAASSKSTYVYVLGDMNILCFGNRVMEGVSYK